MEIDNLVEETNLEATDKIETDQTELHVDQTESLHTHKPLNDQPSRFSSILKLSLDVLDFLKQSSLSPETSLDFWIRKFFGFLIRSVDLALLRWITGTDCHALQHRTPPVPPQPRPPITDLIRSLFLFLSNFGDPENSLRDDPRAGATRWDAIVENHGQ